MSQPGSVPAGRAGASTASAASPPALMALAALMALQASLGLLFPATYRDPELIRAAWFANDLVTLLIVAPLLALSARAAAGGSARHTLVCAGLLFYGVYNYAFYLFGAAIGAWLPLHALLVVASAALLVRLLVRMDRPALVRVVREYRFTRQFAGLLILVGSGLAAVWLAMLGLHVGRGMALPLPPPNFQVVAAVDLTLIVPALAGSGVLLWRGHAAGYVAAPIAAVGGAAYLVVLAASSLVAIHRGLAAAPGEVPLWGGLLLVTGAATAHLLRSVPRSRQREHV